MNEKVIIIAEAGVNHNGDLQKAFDLIDAAAEASADYVKFQSFKAEKLVSRKAIKAEYQKKNTKNDGSSDSQFDMLKKLEVLDDWYPLLIERCNEKGIKFLSTGFDVESLEFLSDKVDFYKIPSGELTNLPYLQKAAEFNLPIVISTGMADLLEVKAATQVLLDSGVDKDDISVLHCNTEYPTPMKDVNLRAMNHLAKELNLKVGYSDHTLGIEVPIAAVALGARIIEKHFTLDRSMDGPDHAASLEPAELSKMVESIRNIELAISGSGLKEPSDSEKKNIVIARKSIHLANDIAKGTIISITDLSFLRPGDGISPMDVGFVIGKRMKVNKQQGDQLEITDFE